MCIIIVSVRLALLFIEPIYANSFYTTLYVCRAWKWRVEVDQRVSPGKVGPREGPFTSTKSACSIVTTCLLYYKRCRLRSSMLKNLVTYKCYISTYFNYKNMVVVSVVCALSSLLQPCKNYWDNEDENGWIFNRFTLKCFSIFIYFTHLDSQFSLNVIRSNFTVLYHSYLVLHFVTAVLFLLLCFLFFSMELFS